MRINIKKIAFFTYENFGPLVVFYFANRVWGLRAAIAASLVFVVVEVVRHRAGKKPVTDFFKFSAVMALVFGSLDLLLAGSFFIRLEAPIANFVTAIFFGASLLRGKPIIQQFAEQQGRTTPNQSGDKTFFFRFLTGIWVAYFLAKAALYLWINYNFPLEKAMALRMVIGNVSFAVLMAITIGLRINIWNALAKFGWISPQDKP